MIRALSILASFWFIGVAVWCSIAICRHIARRWWPGTKRALRLTWRFFRAVYSVRDHKTIKVTVDINKIHYVDEDSIELEWTMAQREARH